MTMAMWNWTTLGIVELLIVLLFSLQPYYGMKTVLFGVAVPEEDRELDQIRALRKRFAWRIWITAIVAFGAGGGVSYSLSGDEAAIILTVTFLQLILFGSIFGMCRQAALKLKSERGWVVTPSERRVASLLPRPQNMTLHNGWFLVHVLVIAVCVIFAIALWDRIPDTVVTHYGMNGKPDTVSPKSIGFVFMLNFIQLFLAGLFWFINYSIRVSKLQLDPKDPEKSLEKQRKFRRINSIFLWALSLVIVTFFGIVQAFMIYDWPQDALNGIVIALPLLLIGSVIGLVIYLTNKGLDQQSNAPVQDERHWRGGGMIYYNPDDAALFVDKRFGMGWTLNFARPMSWVIMGGTIAIPLIIVLFAVLFS
ncbi:DUF1648 domain-containing protein [Cohnella faecalis]|uniref:DUF1648 domain-containing protein n=1 Tax=Cohnella faecalis TaxID=2315694 RepID=A0A398CP92_9BACL|nr:DUF5808 domain-containing protein [Cohnella faecalis]RIE01311.1 DUF1648 domain-containing protein [Cohnella faecalis]